MDMKRGETVTGKRKRDGGEGERGRARQLAGRSKRTERLLWPGWLACLLACLAASPSAPAVLVRSVLGARRPSLSGRAKRLHDKDGKKAIGRGGRAAFLRRNTVQNARKLFPARRTTVTPHTGKILKFTGPIRGRVLPLEIVP